MKSEFVRNHPTGESMMMFAGAAMTALDFLSGLAIDAAKSATRQSSALASAAAATPFALPPASSTAMTDVGRASGTGGGLSADTLQALLALQDFKPTASGDLLSLIDDDKNSKTTSSNAVLQETQRRLKQAEMLAVAAPGRAVTMDI